MDPAATSVTSQSPKAVPDDTIEDRNQSSQSHGPKDPSIGRCNDMIFTIIFYAGLATLVGFASTWGTDVIHIGKNPLKYVDPDASDYDGFIFLSMIITGISFIGAALSMILLFSVPRFLVKVSLLLTLIIALVWMIYSFINSSTAMAVIDTILFVITLWYVYAVWKQIPFATINIVTACTAMRANSGAIVYAYIIALFGGAYSIAWVIAMMGIFERVEQCTINPETQEQSCRPNYGILTILFIWLIYVQQILQNCVRSSVAGAIATWWYQPNECGCCSSGVNRGFIRTATVSFGSICYGSIFTGIVGSIRTLAVEIEENGDDTVCHAIAHCMMSCVSTALEYFNKWSFTTVGLYGMSYLKSGKHAFDLFQDRGWNDIILDDVVGTTLFLLAFIIAILTGGIGISIDDNSDLLDGAGGNTRLISFLLGFVNGLLISTVLLTTIEAGVNAVVVLFATSPQILEQNYPELNAKMCEVWSEIYPDEFNKKDDDKKDTD